MQQTDFTDSFIKSMLGWIRWIASSIANLFQGGSGGSGGSMSTVAWFADNWIKILIALIVIGVVIDWLVWMTRWRPYWVWFRKRRILLENDVDGIDEDDLMMHYGGMVARRGSEEDFDDELDEFDDIRRGEYDEDEEYGEDDEYDADDDHYADDDRYEYDNRGADDRPLRRVRYAEVDAEDDAEDFDGLYDDGDVPKAAGGQRVKTSEPDAEEAATTEDDDLPPRALARKKGFFARGRRKTDDEDDPFRIEGDFFDDLNDAPTREASPTRAVSLDRDAQDTSVYQRPSLLPGDEPGAVRGEDEDDGWHSGYTLRSAERGRRRKRDARA